MTLNHHSGWQKLRCCPDWQRSAEVSEVSRIMKLSVQWSSDDFAAASRNSGTNLCWALKIDVELFVYVCFVNLLRWRNVWFSRWEKENNALQSYYIAFTLSLKKVLISELLVCRYVCFRFCLHQSPTECLCLELCCFCCFPPSA